MAEMNRTVQSIKNARVSLFFSVLVLVLGFFSRKILIDCLGAEVLGLNTTATNLLGFLNLAELGISAAISYTLYTPLFQKDYETINEIVAVQGWLYRRIAYIVLAGAQVIFARKIHLKETGEKSVYNDKAVLFMAILTIMAALFGLVLYRYTVLRYILICIGMIAGVKIALVALKKMKNN